MTNQEPQTYFFESAVSCSLMWNTAVAALNWNWLWLTEATLSIYDNVCLYFLTQRSRKSHRWSFPLSDSSSEVSLKLSSLLCSYFLDRNFILFPGRDEMRRVFQIESAVRCCAQCVTSSEISLPKPLRNLLTLLCSFSWIESRYSCTLSSNRPGEGERIMKLWINSTHLNGTLLLDLFTSQRLPVELSLLDEPAEHLGLHEDLQEAAHSLRGYCFAKTLPLEGAGNWGWRWWGVAVLSFTDDEEWIMSYQLHEEADKSLGHNGAKMSRVW